MLDNLRPVCYNTIRKGKEIPNTRKEKTMTIINNLPDYYTEYPFLVARVYEGNWWFWGCYKTHERAADAAWECGGEVFRLEEVEEGNL